MLGTAISYSYIADATNKYPSLPASSGRGKYYWDVNDERDNDANLRRVTNKDRTLFVISMRYQFHTDAVKDSLYIICGNRIVGIVKNDPSNPIQEVIDGDDGHIGEDRENMKTSYEPPFPEQ